jgi:hypothetical protein
MELNNIEEAPVIEGQVEDVAEPGDGGKPPAKGLKQLIKDAYNAVGYDIEDANINKVFSMYNTDPSKFVKDFWAENGTELPKNVMDNLQDKYLRIDPMKISNYDPNAPKRPARTIANPVKNKTAFTKLTIPKQKEIPLTDAQKKQTVALNNTYNSLDQASKNNWDNNNAVGATRQPDGLRETPKEELDHHDFMQTKLGKTLGGVAYVGSKASHGVIQALKGAAYLTGQHDNTQGTFDKLDKLADYGLTKSDMSNYDDNKIVSAVGGLAEFAPAIAGGETAIAPFLMQGLGTGVETMDKLKKDGVDVNPGVRDAYILTSGIVNHFLMGKLSNTIFPKLSKTIQDDLISKVSVDILKNYTGKSIGDAEYKAVSDKILTTFSDKFKQGAIDYGKNTAHAIKDLAKFNVADYAIKKGADELNDKPIFNQSLGDLAEGLNHTATGVAAPLLALIPSAPAFAKLLPNKSYRNSIVESIATDPSHENVDKIKTELYNHGFEGENKWTSEQMGNAFDFVDQSAEHYREIYEMLAKKKAGNKGQSKVEEKPVAEEPVLKVQDIPQDPVVPQQIIEQPQPIQPIREAVNETAEPVKDSNGVAIGDFVTDVKGNEHQVFGYSENGKGYINEYGSEIPADQLQLPEQKPAKRKASRVGSEKQPGFEHISNPLNDSLEKLGYGESDYSKLDDTQKQYLVENNVEKPKPKVEIPEVDHKAKVSEIFGKMGIEVQEEKAPEITKPKVKAKEKPSETIETPQPISIETPHNSDVKEEVATNPTPEKVQEKVIHFSRPQVANILRTKPEGLVEETTLDDRGKKELFEKKQKIQFVIKKKFNDLTKAKPEEFNQAMTKLVHNVMNYRRRNLIKGEKSYSEKGSKDVFNGMSHWIDSIEGVVEKHIPGGRGRAQELVQHAQSEWAKAIDQNERGGKAYNERLSELGKAPKIVETVKPSIEATDVIADKPVSKIHEKPEMENPVHSIQVNGKERFIQRLDEMNSGSSWYEVKKSDNGTWGLADGKIGTETKSHLGDTKKEAIDRIGSKDTPTPIVKAEKSYKEPVEESEPEVKDDYYKSDEEPSAPDAPKDTDIKDEVDTRQVQVGEDANGRAIKVRAEDLAEYNKTVDIINKKLQRIEDAETETEKDIQRQLINKQKDKLKGFVDAAKKPSKSLIEKDIKENKTIVKNLNTQKSNIEASSLIERAEALANRLNESGTKKIKSGRGSLSLGGITPDVIHGVSEKLASHLIKGGIRVVKTAASLKKYFIELTNKKEFKGTEFDEMTPSQRKNVVKIINSMLDLHYGGERKIAENSSKYLDKNKSEAKAIEKNKGGLTALERFKRNFTDRAAKLTEGLKKEGNKKIDENSATSETYGERAVRLFNSMSGSSNKAEEMYQKAFKDVFGSPLLGGEHFLSEKEQRVLSLIINMKRISEIDRLRMERHPDKELAEHPGGYSYVTAEKTLADLKAGTTYMKDAHGEYSFDELNGRADKYFDAMQSLLDIRYENGLISDASYKTMKEAKFYSPRQFMKYINNDLNFNSKHISTSNGVKKLGEGSDQAYVDNPAYLLRDAMGMVHHYLDQNKAYSSINEMLTNVDTEMGRPAKYSGGFMKRLREHYSEKEANAQLPTVNLFGVQNSIEETPWKYIAPEFETPAEGETLFKFYDKGVQKGFIMKNAYAVELNGFDQVINRRAFGLWSGARLKQAMATGLNAYFAVSNTIRDGGYVLFTTDHYSPIFPVAAAQYSKDWVSALKDAWTKGKTYKDFVAEGGGREFLGGEPKLFAGEESQIRAGLNEIWYQLGHRIPQTSEIAGRLAVRGRVINKLTEQYKKEGKVITPELQKEIQERASFLAASTMDFSHGGRVTKEVNAVIPFFNAGILGTRNLFRYAKDNPAKFGVKLLQLAAVNAALAQWNHGVLGNDEDSKDRGDYYRRYISANDKSVNHIIMLPFKYTDDRGVERYPYIKIPKPQEQKLFSGVFEHLALKAHGIDDNYIKERGMMDASSLATYIPDGGNFLPAILSPFASYMSNHDFFRNESYYKGMTKVLPKDEYNDKTPMSYRKLGELINMSPDRLKGAFESAVPTNNQIFDLVNFSANHLGLGSREYYRNEENKKSWLDQLGSVSKHMPDEDKNDLNKFISETLHNLPGAKRLMGITTTSPIDSERQQLIMEGDSEKKRLSFEMQDYIKRYENNKHSDDKITEDELFDAAQRIGSDKNLGADGTTDVVRLVSMAKLAVKGQDATQFAKDMRYISNDPEIQARNFYHLMQGVPDQAKRVEYLKQIEESNMFSSRFYQALEELEKSDKK